MCKNIGNGEKLSGLEDWKNSVQFFSVSTPLESIQYEDVAIIRLGNTYLVEGTNYAALWIKPRAQKPQEFLITRKDPWRCSAFSIV